MRHPTAARPAFALGLLVAGAACAAAAGFTDIGSLNGGAAESVAAMSPDGSTLVLSANDGAASNANRASLWTPGGGITSLGVLNGGSASFGAAISADGTTVVGTANDGAAANAQRAFVWTQAGGMVSLGTLNAGSQSSASAVSSDGSVVAGGSADGSASDNFRAFRWTQAGGMVGLGVLNGGTRSIATGMSRDGSVIVGDSNDGAAGNQDRAFVWTQAGGMVSLGVFNAGLRSNANAVSGDGTVVVGSSFDGSNSNRDTAFRWTQAGGLQSLGMLDGGVLSVAEAVNNDGVVIVGNAKDGANGNVLRAFRWTQASGMQTVEAWLRSTGVSVPSDITQNATGVNDAGTVVAGSLTSGAPFYARAGSGLITLPEVSAGLTGSAGASAQASGLGAVAFNGAHSRPLARRVASGKSCVWASGDVGRDDHGARDGDFALGEVGGCHAFTEGFQGALSAGHSYSRQDLADSGRSEVNADYGVAELLANVPRSRVWASAGFFYQAGEAKVDRGYLNAGVQDFSRGRPDVETLGVRARADWLDAARWGEVSLTPYLDFSRAHTKIDGYTETGGGFPARFDSRAEDVTELRYGGDAAYALSAAVKLLGRVEGAHRFEAHGASATGQVVGLFTFDLPGQTFLRDWLRGGAGVEAKLGPGTASLMLNATTQGSAPSAWLNAGYQLTF